MSQRYLGGIITANPTAPTFASASGVWTLEQQFQYLQGLQAKNISNSLRFRSSASAYLNRTPVSAGNRNTWTWSAWVKRGTLGAAQTMFVGYPSSTVYAYIGFTSSDQIRYASTNSGASLTTTPVYRDPSAWYHIVFAYDDTQATASNRLKLYVNGVQVTAFGTASYPTQNFGDYINSANVHNIGRFPSGVEYCDCYFAETYFIDGQALTPSSFGAFDISGVWQPIAYTGTYGTNGFYLNYGNTTSTTTLGYDTSGNGNNWTTNNISLTAGVTYDSMIDSPSNYADGGTGRGNYATLNPANKGSNGVTLSEGNLAYTSSGNTGACRVLSTIGMTTGKWYCEFVGTGNSSYNLVGIALSTESPDAGYLGASSGSYGYYANSGNKYNAGANSAYGATYGTGDIIGIAFDADAGTLTFYKNGTSQGVAYSGIPAGTYYFGQGDYSVTFTGAFNFGQRPFSYTPPTGYKALNTQNLPASTINNGAQYMAATLYTSTGTTQTINNGSNTTIGTTFQPDFVWQKARSNVQDNYLIDSVRGASNYLISNSTTAEATAAQFLTSFNSNGVTFGTSNLPNGWTNVAWQWKESPTAGFDIVPYTFASTGTATISHNLGAVPKMILAKRLNATEQWLVYQSSATTQSQYLGLNTTAAVASSANLWGSSAFTSSQFYFTATTGYQYIFYLFADVAGYSKFGSYTGNGSTDGVFVYLGFRPRWLMVKRSSSGAGTANWVVIDTSRDTYNLAGQSLEPNLSDAEYTPASSGYPLDILSNGFKQRGSSVSQNENGSTYIFAAFAENPFNIARAR